MKDQWQVTGETAWTAPASLLIGFGDVVGGKKARTVAAVAATSFPASRCASQRSIARIPASDTRPSAKASSASRRQGTQWRRARTWERGGTLLATARPRQDGRGRGDQLLRIGDRLLQVHPCVVLLDRRDPVAEQGGHHLDGAGIAVEQDRGDRVPYPVRAHRQAAGRRLEHDPVAQGGRADGAVLAGKERLAVAGEAMMGDDAGPM